MTSWRPKLKLRPTRRRTYDAVHNVLYDEVEAHRALTRQYEDELNLVPESHFDGDQVAFQLGERADDFLGSKQARRHEMRARVVQTGSAD